MNKQSLLPQLLTLLADYQALLQQVDAWFDRCLVAVGPQQIRCRRGCSECCRGLFDISVLDAALLQQGVAQLPLEVQGRVRQQSRSRLTELQERWPTLNHPWLLNSLPDEGWTEMPEDDATPCPLLGADGACMVYAYRPMTCRLHGLPNIDLSGESFSDDFCSHNFVGVDPLLLPELRWEFRRTFADENNFLHMFTTILCGRPLRELDTFIPTGLLIDFDNGHWEAATQGLR
jgi:Fe-S-cluster containining protein